MSRYKVLEVPKILKNKSKLFKVEDYWDNPIKINPIFNRPGLYFDRTKNMCWVETSYGCWEVGNRDNFNCELGYVSNDENILHPSVEAALHVLRKNKLLKGELREKYWKHLHAVELRKVYRDTRKFMLK